MALKDDIVRSGSSEVEGLLHGVVRGETTENAATQSTDDNSKSMSRNPTVLDYEDYNALTIVLSPEVSSVARLGGGQGEEGNDDDEVMEASDAVGDMKCPPSTITKRKNQKVHWELSKYCCISSVKDVNNVQYEAKRLLNLKSYNILDTAQEEEFESLTKEASEYFNVPIVAVSLVDLGRQWFKSQVGLGSTRETPRAWSFCDHVVRRKDGPPSSSQSSPNHPPVSEVLVVNDARLDERFCDNPLVTGELNIRFYAGAPIISPEGYKLGAFCIIDNVNPHPEGLTIAQQEKLQEYAFEASVNILIR